MKPDQYTTLKPYKTSLKEVPKVGGLKEKDGWLNMQVQFLINQKTCNSDKLLVGWTVLPPGAQHDRHRHFNCDEFWIVIKGDVVFTPRGHWHGFKNNSQQDVVLAWGWSGAGSLEAAGYESVEGGRTH
jgi:mannose-6-phosphate isomerase-like protein (cupin superfamily)